jgi:hypothetical protein
VVAAAAALQVLEHIEIKEVGASGRGKGGRLLGATTAIRTCV